MIGADGKVIIERLCISLPYVETFNSKVIKGFVPELRSRYVFFMFRDSYVLCIYVMNILCTFHIFMYGYVTVIEHENDGDSNYNWCVLEGLVRGLRAGNQKTCRDHPNYSITKIGQNTQRSTGDLKRLAVIQTPMKNHQLIQE